MQSIVSMMAAALPCPLRANAGKYDEECVEYGFNTTLYNGARYEVRMKLHIVARTMARGLELETLLDRLLVRRDETPLTETVTACARNGGGWLVDGGWHIRIAYYDMVIRDVQGLTR